MPSTTHPDLEILRFTVKVEGKEPVTVSAGDNDEVEFKIPESSSYTFTLHFKVKNRALNNLRYKQVVKRHGLTVKSRELDIGDFEPSTEEYSKEFPPDTTPGGFLVRGAYNATSTYFAGEEELKVVDWTLEITKK